MGGDDILLDKPRLTASEFRTFYDTRPAGERWELIDGEPMQMMTPPALVHQRIEKNLEQMLDAALTRVQPSWTADREIGVQDPDDQDFNPEPDVTVIDLEIEAGQTYAERFYFVAEVLSDERGSHKRLRDLALAKEQEVLAKKLGVYSSHVHCRAVLFVRQDRIEATLYPRHDDFRPLTLVDAAARIIISDIGDIGPLGGLYRHTPLFPKMAMPKSG